MNDETTHLQLTDADTVLPCPFCGSDDIELQNTWTPSYWLQCQGCCAEVHDNEMWNDAESHEEHQASKARVLAEWNKRVPSHAG